MILQFYSDNVYTHTQTHKYTYMYILFYLLYIKKKVTEKHLMRQKKRKM